VRVSNECDVAFERYCNVYLCPSVQSRLSGVELAATVFVNVHLKRIMEKLDEPL